MTLKWMTGGMIVVRRLAGDPTGWDTFYAVKVRMVAEAWTASSTKFTYVSTEKKPNA